MSSFSPATQAWFRRAFAGPTPVQERGWASIAQGDHSLLLAPTGSGKTLAAFLWCIDRLVREPALEGGVRVLYVSPLKALVYDVERNLRTPLHGIAQQATTMGLKVQVPRVAIRTGDTSTKERQQHLRDPAQILVTTPESLYLMLGSQVRATLASVDTIIVDEVHALAPSKRGAHLALSLERLSFLCGKDPQRIGLSATASPIAEVARFLGGDREVTVIDTSAKPNLDLRIVVPVPDMTNPGLRPEPETDVDVDDVGHVDDVINVDDADIPRRARGGRASAGAQREDSTASAGHELVRDHDEARRKRRRERGGRERDDLQSAREGRASGGARSEDLRVGAAPEVVNEDSTPARPQLREGGTPRQQPSGVADEGQSSQARSPASRSSSKSPTSDHDVHDQVPPPLPTGPILAAASPPATGEPVDNSIWPAIYPRLLELIAAHRTTIIFVNSRGLCERLAQRLSELAGDETLVRAHHGSIARSQRERIEDLLKSGEIKALVATSSLELGIDMGTVDLVVMVESPGAVSRGLQRVGRAGHGVGEQSRGLIFPKHRGDLLEATVVADRMRRGELEALAYPRNPLDVLAQHIVAMCAVEPWSLHDLERVVHRSANFRELPQDALTAVLDMLAGRYPSHAFADLRPRITWDRDTDTLTGRRGAKQIAVLSGGTIPDRGTYAVHLGHDGPRVGELDEEMVHEAAPGQNITLGATTWRIDEITRDRVIVSPAPGEPGKLPFWRGDGPGRPLALGMAMGAFTAQIARRRSDDARAWLERDYGLDAWAAENLVAYVHEQRLATGTVPTDASITIERFRDELGDWRICIHTPFGARIHAPWALALQTRLEAMFGFEIQALWSDDGIVLRLVDVEDMPDIDVLLPDPDEVEEQVVEQLGHSALFAGQFRENAARALLLPRRKAGARTPLWAQRLKSQQLLAVARQYPSFPIIIETYRSCLRDTFDVPALVELLRAIASRKIRVEAVETSGPSPFARSLVFAYVAAYLYEGDAPLAERKAQALALDRKLLRELLGQEELRELLDAEVIDELEAELQGLAEERKARHPDDLHDLLRRVGDLSAEEIAARCEDDPGPWIESLLRARRIVRVRVGEAPRLVAVEDVGLYRDALGCPPPPGIASAFLEPVERPWEVLVARYARTHGPFEPDVLARRYAVPIGQVETALLLLEGQQALVRGEFRPHGHGLEWCDAEVLRRIKRRTLARLRGEIAPVEAKVLGRFLPAWYGIGAAQIGPARLEQALAQLEGLPLSFDELEQVILPARVPGFAPRMLDELGAMGWLVWVGRGALGKRDGRVALYRRERVSLLLEPPEIPEDLGPLQARILEHLMHRGASFFVELQMACGPEARIEEVREALWDLVWAGFVTNDTFAAVRNYHSGGSVARPRRGLPGSASSGGAVGGRWSFVRDLVPQPVEPTQRAHAMAVTLLERHGIVAREVMQLEHLPGGFSAVYRVLRAMEESGKVRRGYFVEDLGGAQFASPGAVDRLRAQRSEQRSEPEARTLALSAVDPANPFGWLLPWPARIEGQSGPRRVPGATVVLVGGELVLWLDKGGRRLVTFAPAEDREVAIMAASALTDVARRQRGKLLRIETIDGDPARTSKHAERLRAANFTSDPRGLVLEGR